MKADHVHIGHHYQIKFRGKLMVVRVRNERRVIVNQRGRMTRRLFEVTGKLEPKRALSGELWLKVEAKALKPLDSSNPLW